MRAKEQVPFRLWAPGRLHTVISLAVATATGLLPAVALPSPAAYAARLDLPEIQSIALSRSTVPEGSEGADERVMVTVTMTGPSADPMTLKVATGESDTAVEAADGVGSGDYEVVDTVDVEANASAAIFHVFVNSDEIFEADEQIQLTVAPAEDDPHVTGAAKSAPITIQNDDAEPTIEFDEFSEVEGTPGIAVGFDVTGQFQGPLAWSATLEGAAADGSDPAEDDDFTRDGSPLSGVLEGNQTRIELGAVELALGSADEFDETIKASVDVQSIGGFSGFGVIRDSEDHRPPRLVVDPGPPVVEGQTADITVRTGYWESGNQASSTEKSISFTYGTGGDSATAGTDYEPKSGEPVTMAPGVTEKSLSVVTKTDEEIEPDETVDITLSNLENATVLMPSTPVTIKEATPEATPPTVDVAEAEMVVEGEKLLFPLTLSHPSDETITVRVSTRDALATADEDYEAVSELAVEFPPTKTTAVVEVQTKADPEDSDRGDPETVELVISDPGTASPGNDHALGLIQDPTKIVNGGGGHGVEGGEGLKALFNLTGALVESSIPWTATITGVAGEGDNADAGPADYDPSKLTLSGTIEPGDAILDLGVVEFPVDRIAEHGEGLTLTVDAGPAGTASAMFVASDPPTEHTPAMVTPADVAVVEGQAATIPLTLDFAAISGNTATSTEQSIYVNYTIEAGTAGADDYTVSTEEVTFAPGDLSKTVSIPTRADDLPEKSETFKVTFESTTGMGWLEDSVTTVTVRDPGVSLVSVLDTVVAEGGKLRFPVTLSDPVDVPVTVKVRLTGKSADAEADFTPIGEQDVVFTPGSTEQWVEVQTTADDVDEPMPESVVLEILDPGTAVLDKALATGDVIDATVLVIPQGVITEGDSGTREQRFDVLLTAPIDTEVRLSYEVLAGEADGRDVATPGQDFDAVPGTELVFAPNETKKEIIVPIRGDTEDEGAGETIRIRLFGLTGVKASGVEDGTFLIVDDEGAPSVAMVSPLQPRNEGSTTTQVPVTVTLSNPAPGPLTLTVTGDDKSAVKSAGGVGSADYDVPATVEFAQGDTTKTFTVTVKGDTVFEETEIAEISVSPDFGDPAVTGGSWTFPLVLTNDDAPPTAQVTRFEAAEGSTGVRVKATVVGDAQASLFWRASAVGGAHGMDGGSDAAEPEDFDASGLAASGDLAPGADTLDLGVIDFREDTADEHYETVAVKLELEAPGSAPHTDWGTIVDDEHHLPPGILIPETATATEGGIATIPLELDFENPIGNRAESTEKEITLDYTITPGTATAGDDYTPDPGQVTIRPSATTGSVTVPITADDIADAGETFTVTFANPLNAADGSGGSTVVTINDGPRTVSVGTPATVAEGRRIRFPLTLSRAADEAVTVRVSTTNGTATAGTDYTPLSGVDVTFAPGSTTAYAEVATLADQVAEETAKTVGLTIVDPGTAAPGTTEAVGEMIDAALTITPVGVITEGADGVRGQVFDLRLNVAQDAAIDLDYEVIAGSATDADFDPVGNTRVTFAPGETAKQITVRVRGDALDEGSGETFTIKVTGMSGGAPVAGIGEHPFTIVDDDDGVPSAFTVTPDVTAVEGQPGAAELVVRLDAPATDDVDFTVAAVDGTARRAAGVPGGDDFVTPAGILRIVKGQQTGTIIVPIRGDDVFEEKETAEITVAVGPGETAVTGEPQKAVLTITDDDAVPTLTLNDAASGAEGGTVAVTATPSGVAEDPIGYLLRLTGDAAGGADAAEVADFAGGTVDVTLPGGSTGPVTLHSIALGSDTVDEAIETIKASLESSTVPSAASAEARYTITDDPLDLPPTVSVGGATVPEEQGVAEVPFSLDFTGGNDATSTEQPVSVTFDVFGETADSTDFGPPLDGAGIVVPAGQRNGVIRVPIVNDRRTENPETFYLRLLSAGPEGAAIGGGLGAVVITDDDANAPRPEVTLSGDVTAGEEAGSATFEVRLSEPAAGDVDLDIAVEPGTADAGTDFTPPVATVRIPEGAVSAQIGVAIPQDAVYEGDETAVLTVSLAAGELDAAGAPRQSTLTITDDDPEPVVTLAQTAATVNEGGSLEVAGTVTGTAQRDFEFRNAAASVKAAAASAVRTQAVVRIKPGVKKKLIVDRRPLVRALAVEDAEPADFDLGDGFTIPAGTPSGSKVTLGTIRFRDDTVDEGDETATFSVGDSVITVRIVDDPADRPPAVSVGDASVSEDDEVAEVPVTLDFRGGASSTERVVTVPWQTVDGTAEAGRDYRKAGGTVTIDPLAGSATVRVPLINDTRDEKAQSFTIRLGAPGPAGVTVTGGPGTVVIADDDRPKAPTLTAPASLVGSGRVPISGVAAAGAKVELLSAGGVAGGTLKVIGSTVADDDGAYAFQPNIGIGIRFQTRAAGLSSPVRTVQVRQEPTVTAVSNARGQVTVTVVGDPDEGGQTVRVQRQVRGEWREVDDGRLGPKGRFATTVRGLTPGGNAVFRAVISATPSLGILAGASAARTVKVR